MRPASMASKTIRFGRPVLIPTMVGPAPASCSTISQVWRYLRVGLSLSDSQMLAPGVTRPFIEPVLAHVAVMVLPSSSSTSHKKRL